MWCCRIQLSASQLIKRTKLGSGDSAQGSSCPLPSPASFMMKTVSDQGYSHIQERKVSGTYLFQSLCLGLVCFLESLSPFLLQNGFDKSVLTHRYNQIVYIQDLSWQKQKSLSELGFMITKAFASCPSGIRHTLTGTLHSLQQRKWSSHIFQMNLHY